ncbi:MAG TPA: 50S ribosomal protein L11 methyltransferase [Burkholderiales bacterium]|nr:50S ribosomal protein L11 methyltransferase [Burkholderiales bacterium]
MAWLALTLEIAAEAAEAMSEALLEAGAHSVLIDDVELPRQSLTAVVSPDTAVGSLVHAAAHRAGLAGIPAYTLRKLADDDWVQRTQSQFGPIEVGARLWIGPSWHEPKAGRAAVRLDPGLAFGTGTHPTTRLMLDFLEMHIQGGERVLDYGCGSGILAIAAAKLGAAHIDAVDTDPVAVETTAQNARTNRVELNASLPEALPSGVYDLVLSNILAQPLITLAPVLAARTAARGRIALSGILQSQASDVASAYAPWFNVCTARLDDVWVLLEGSRR